MHRGRFAGGNARKRKAKLTDATFHAMLGSPMAGAGHSLVSTQETGAVEGIEADGIVFERSLRIEETIVELAVLSTSTILPAVTEGREFSCQDFDFGYAECPTCHNDQAYYVRRTDLAGGFSFRCRVCRSSMTAWVK